MLATFAGKLVAVVVVFVVVIVGGAAAFAADTVVEYCTE